jgi:hypothetical protein
MMFPGPERSPGLTLFVDAGAALVVGIVSGFFIDPENGLIIGMVAFLAIEAVRSRFAAQEAVKTANRLSAWFEALRSDEKLAEIPLVWGLKRAARLRHNSVSVSGKHNAWDFWVECMQKTDQSWRTVNYADVTNWWGTHYVNSSALRIQRERLDADCKIERVFCVETKEEAIALSDMMEDQASMNIHVGWVLRSELAEADGIKEALGRLDGFDVAIADGKWVYQGHLSAQRQVIGASLRRDEDLRRAADIVIKEAEHLATWITERPEHDEQR